MLRRDFLKSSVALAAAVELGAGEAHGLVRAHNWGTMISVPALRSKTD